MPPTTSVTVRLEPRLIAWIDRFGLGRSDQVREDLGCLEQLLATVTPAVAQQLTPVGVAFLAEAAARLDYPFVAHGPAVWSAVLAAILDDAPADLAERHGVDPAELSAWLQTLEPLQVLAVWRLVRSHRPPTPTP